MLSAATMPSEPRLAACASLFDGSESNRVAFALLTRLLTATVEENVLVQLENLRTLQAVASRLARGDLHLHGWVYKIETGEVFASDSASGQFVPLAEYKFPASEAAVRLRITGDI